MKALWRRRKCGVSQINCFCSTEPPDQLQNGKNAWLDKNCSNRLPGFSALCRQHIAPPRFKINFKTRLEKSQLYVSYLLNEKVLFLKFCNIWLCKKLHFTSLSPLEGFKFWLVLFESLYWKKSFKLLFRETGNWNSQIDLRQNYWEKSS